MRTPLWIVAGLATAIAPVDASGAPAGRSPAERIDPYRRAIDQAIDRAEERLLRTVEPYAAHTTWEDPWVVTTEHYVVRTTRSHYFGQVLGRGLDTMIGFYQQALRTDWVPARPFSVDVLPDLQRYNEFGDQFGAEHSSFYGSFYAAGNPQRPVAALYDPNFVRLRRTLTHSAAHQYIAAAFPAQAPVWVSEGLAKYFELHWNFEAGIADFRRVQADNRLWIPLDDLLGASIQEYGDRTSTRLLQLGALFTYLYSYRDETRTVWQDGQIVAAPFGDYLNALLSGRDVRRLPAHELLTRRLDQLDSDLRSFAFE